MRERISFEHEIGRLGIFPEQEILPSHRTQQVDRLLRDEKSFQQWRILALLKCGAVELIRNGARTKIVKETEKLKNGDQIDLQSPLNSQCQLSIDNIPETEYRDYAFANPDPKDDYEKFLIKYLGMRPQTIVLSNSSVDTVAAFTRALAKGDRITHPIRNLILASHASRTGLLALPLSLGAPARIINFEVLEAAVTSKTLAIDPKLLEPRPKSGSQPLAAKVHIKGCNIGNDISLPFLKMLKAALGGGLGITAPRFFHSMKIVNEVKKRGGRIISRKMVEIWEFFSYEFVLFRTSALRTKSDAVGEFQKVSAFQRIDKSAVPQSDWNRWIPSTLPPANKVKAVTVPLTSSLSNKANSADAEFRYRKTFFLNKEWHDLSIAADPGSDALRKDEIKKRLLASDKRFDPGHAFPFFKRTGFKTIDEYFDSFSWRFKPFDSKKQKLAFSGTRHEYTVLAPVVDTTTNELFMNLFPIGGTPTITLHEDDTRFFTLV